MRKIVLKDILFLVTTLSIIVILLFVVNVTANGKIKSTNESYLKSDKNDVSQNNIQSSTKNTAFKTTILSTGKSDCILIEIGDKFIMVDTGEDKNGEQIVDKLKEKEIKALDYLIKK
ncbi:MBL fold metallo-hydrolase [Clostridioides difficile]|nr:MBL fold metallo-hydrolase [Clostridioides difficile]MDN9435843.1 MBL fold metallo-hydrolase [Clostridioides difficile]